MIKGFVATALVVGLSLAFSDLSVVSAITAETIVFRNIAVFDGARLVRRTSVLVQDGLIREVRPDLTIPPSARIVEGEGRTLLPGLIDAHTHLGFKFGEQFLQDALIFGVTMELEMWGGDVSRALGKVSDPGRADLLTAGTGVTAPKGHPTQMGGAPIPTLGPDDDAQKFVDARIAEGLDYIKIVYDHSFPTLTPRQLTALAAAGHRRKKLVVAHVRTQSEARDAIAAGVDGLVHIFADAPPAADVIEMAARRGVFVVATLSVIESATRKPDTTDALWWQSSPLLSRITPSMQQLLERKMPAALGVGLSLAHAQAVVGALHRAGVPVLAGTDAPAAGLAHGVSMHRELELLVLSGMTPSEALAAATSVTARLFGLRDRGRIAPGLRADLMLINGDPTIDIRATRDIAGVWKLGTNLGRINPIARHSPSSR